MNAGHDGRVRVARVPSPLLTYSTYVRKYVSLVVCVDAPRVLNLHHAVVGWDHDKTHAGYVDRQKNGRERASPPKLESARRSNSGSSGSFLFSCGTASSCWRLLRGRYYNSKSLLSYEEVQFFFFISLEKNNVLWPSKRFKIYPRYYQSDIGPQWKRCCISGIVSRPSCTKLATESLH